MYIIKCAVAGADQSVSVGTVYDTQYLSLIPNNWKQLAELIIKSLQEDQVRKTVVDIVVEMCRDPAILAAATDLALYVVAQKSLLNLFNSN